MQRVRTIAVLGVQAALVACHRVQRVQLQPAPQPPTIQRQQPARAAPKVTHQHCREDNDGVQNQTLQITAAAN